MNNPCKECLLINNCTAICEDKTNFQTLLREATRHSGFGTKVRNSQDRALHRKWVELQTENNMDMANIIGRASRLKSGTGRIRDKKRF